MFTRQHTPPHPTYTHFPQRTIGGSWRDSYWYSWWQQWSSNDWCHFCTYKQLWLWLCGFRQWWCRQVIYTVLIRPTLQSHVTSLYDVKGFWPRHRSHWFLKRVTKITKNSLKWKIFGQRFSWSTPHRSHHLQPKTSMNRGHLHALRAYHILVPVDWLVLHQLSGCWWTLCRHFLHF